MTHDNGAYVKALWRWFRWDSKDAIHDVWDRLLGYCVECPSAPSGGYRHWRCDLRRHHEGPHRFRNYIWRGRGYPVEYLPVDHEGGRFHRPRPYRMGAGWLGRHHLREREVLNEAATVATRRRIAEKDRGPNAS